MAGDWAQDLAGIARQRAEKRQGRVRQARRKADDRRAAGPTLLKDVHRALETAAKVISAQGSLRVAVTRPVKEADRQSFAVLLGTDGFRLTLDADGVLRVARGPGAEPRPPVAPPRGKKPAVGTAPTPAPGAGLAPWAWLTVERDRFGRGRIRAKRAEAAVGQTGWLTVDDVAREVLTRLVEDHVPGP